MVSSVGDSLSSSAYIKSSRLAGNSGDQARRDTAPTPTQDNQPRRPDRTDNTERAAPPSDVERTERSPETDVTRTDTRPQPDDNTQLEARNDTQTLQTEQTRGSLLDLAV